MRTWQEAQAVMTELGVGGSVERSISRTERQYLFEMCQKVGAETVIELGTYAGISALSMALSGARVITVDKMDVNADESVKLPVDCKPCDLMKRAGVNVEFVHSDSLAFMKEYDGPVDMMFIDGNKDEKKCYAEIMEGLRLGVKLIVVDDVIPHGIPAKPGGYDDPGYWQALETLKETHPRLDVRYIPTAPDGSFLYTGEVWVCADS